MLVAIVTLFAICWSPTLIDNVLSAFNVIDPQHLGSIKHLRQAFALMSYANSCVNPVVYAFMSKNFRAGFVKTLACGRVSSGSRSRLDSQRLARGGGGTVSGGHGGRHCIGGGPTSTIMMTSCRRHQDAAARQMSPAAAGGLGARGGGGVRSSGSQLAQTHGSGMVTVFVSGSAMVHFKPGGAASADRPTISGGSEDDDVYEIVPSRCD